MLPMNETTCFPILHDDPLCFESNYAPFYYFNKQTLIDGFSDHYLTLAAPIIAYWSLSLFFHFLDTRSWNWLNKYRIHPSEEVQARNLASRSSVIWAVIFQHILQTILGLYWLSDDSLNVANHNGSIRRIAIVLQPVMALTGYNDPFSLVAVAEFVFWWTIPFGQLFTAMFIIDTWQYFLHRFMHANKFLYKHLHSWHHRLYVPYAFGSLYNHPIEGFFLDTLGAAIAEWATGMTTRQAMVLFSISTFKTVDDHCGYSLPWDPLQLVTGNNADYHDIHHQVIGIKSNFAQPFFVHWDTLLGTRMTRQDIEERKRNYKAKLQ